MVRVVSVPLWILLLRIWVGLVQGGPRLLGQGLLLSRGWLLVRLIRWHWLVSLVPVGDLVPAIWLCWPLRLGQPRVSVGLLHESFLLALELLEHDVRVLEWLNFDGSHLFDGDGRLVVRLEEGDLGLSLAEGIELGLPEVSQLVVHVIH